MNIYIQKEGTDFGPYSIEQVKELIQIVAFSQHHQAYHNGQYWILSLRSLECLLLVLVQSISRIGKNDFEDMEEDFEFE